MCVDCTCRTVCGVRCVRSFWQIARKKYYTFYSKWNFCMIFIPFIVHDGMEGMEAWKAISFAFHMYPSVLCTCTLYSYALTILRSVYHDYSTLNVISTCQLACNTSTVHKFIFLLFILLWLCELKEHGTHAVVASEACAFRTCLISISTIYLPYTGNRYERMKESVPLNREQMKCRYDILIVYKP